MLWKLYVSIKTMIERPRMWPKLETLRGWLASNCLRVKVGLLSVVPSCEVRGRRLL